MSLGDRRISPSALNPLLSDRSNTTDDEEYTMTPPISKTDNANIMDEPYKKLGMFANGHVVMADDKRNCNGILPSTDQESDQTVPGTLPAQNSHPPTRELEDSLSTASASTVSSLSEPRSPDKLPATSRIVPDVLPPSNPSSYVRWTQLLPDLKNDAMSNRQSSSYCQVGII